ncbi:MAG: hypothetical protein H0V18_13585 [Pyrinomonadaceae bacterium]|nr:hypothetical protein [Pyrinomonadaceae bacterium]
MTESGRRNLFLALCAIALLHTGAHISQSYVNYPTWHLIESESFKPYHWAITIRAGVFLAAPRLLEIVLGLIVLRFPPAAIKRRIILVGIGLAVGALLSTMLLSRPVHRQLDIQSNTPELLARLMATDWVRNVLEWLRAGLYLWALSRLLKFNERVP